MKRRLFGILLSLALAAGMMPALSMTAHAVDHVIQEGSTYKIDGSIYFGDDTPLYIQWDDESGKEKYQYFTGTATLIYQEYLSDTGQHAFGLVHEGTSYNLCISDTDSSEPWGIAVTGGDGSSEENAFTFKVLHEEPVDYQLWIKGTQATNWNKDDVLGDGTVSYDPDKGILTLKGADITADAGSAKIFGYTGINYSGDEDLIIDATEPSTVTAMEEGNFGITSARNLTLKGTLSASGDVSGIGCSGSKITVSGKVNATGRGTGVYLESGDITVESGAELTAAGDEAAGIGINDDNGTVTVRKGAKLSAVGGAAGAIDAIVKNAIAGKAWTDRNGTEGETDIDVNIAGERLDKKFKKAQFPAEDPDVTEYTISFDLNGGTLDGETGTVEWAVEEGAVIVLPEPVKEGCTFDYWEGSRHYAGDEYTVTEDHRFTAVWKTGAGGDGSKGGSSKGVRTGDENALGAWTVLLLAALAGTTGMAFARKRKGE